jgi:hypothetical protein
LILLYSKTNIVKMLIIETTFNLVPIDINHSGSIVDEWLSNVVFNPAVFVLVVTVTPATYDYVISRNAAST